MTRHRASSLRYFTRHCPRALKFHEDRAPMDRDFFAAGIAAHAVLQAIGEATARGANATPEQIADAATLVLMRDGRSFDGHHEPPLPPDAVTEGRDLALRWALANPPAPTARHEAGLAIDAEGNACAYDAEHARYVAILDMLDVQEVGDDETSGRAAIVTEYKTAWPTDESELDTIQCRGHAVLVAAAHQDIDLIIRRVVNLRTMQTFEHTLSPEYDADTLAQWRRDILTLCEAADETREARPGAGCGGCPWAHCCDDAWAAVKSGSDVATQFAVAQALRDDLVALAKLVCKESVQPVPDGVVGYLEKPSRSVPVDAYRDLAAEWCNVPPDDRDDWAASNAQWLGLLSACGLGVTQITAAAKRLYPGRENAAGREDLIERCTVVGVRKEFGVRRQQPTETDA